MKTRLSAIAGLVMLVFALTPALNAQRVVNRSSAEATLHLNVYVVPVVMNGNSTPAVSMQNEVRRSTPSAAARSEGGVVFNLMPRESAMQRTISQSVVQSFIPDPQPTGGRGLAVLETTLVVPR